ncbi:2-hydroxychromene-2-carboxylate isomerase [Gemmobacter fulvus]|uniref:2-hydroxychromene-2-carboxylate isomerase n=1 Tax=Gemmobacter fulvus TaxID=2840474 RepID=A0A975P7S5_9RHOB|nr:2-hydroxychromene-2-carboxylate isomerase [Gemmobacter fulvus]MBT9247508.1 2-hydroxychromene-2-carboxylate isomerase [Gemmobacter fulvus]QWK89981.1 2-hydroxychromene-2-carboxylate isomerase [Gemmobacter fulvus]
MAHIDYFFATVSPFVYLAGQRLEAVAAKHGASIHYKPLDPAALFARTGGVTLAQRHDSRKAYRLQELRRQSAKLGLPINLQPQFWPVNPAPSGYAIIAAQAAGGGDVGALAHGLARACWAENRNIAEDEVIREELVKAGFAANVADRGMLSAAETYAVNLEEAVSRGAFGVPFYMVGDECFWGQDHIEDLDLYLAGRA